MSDDFVDLAWNDPLSIYIYILSIYIYILSTYIYILSIYIYILSINIYILNKNKKNTIVAISIQNKNIEKITNYQ